MLIPAVPAITIYGGPDSTFSGTGKAGGGSYHKLTGTPGVTATAEAGVQAWATTAGGIGEGYAAYFGTAHEGTTFNDGTATNTLSVSADVANADIKAGVSQTTAAGAIASYAGIYAQSKISGAEAYGEASNRVVIGDFKALSAWRGAAGTAPASSAAFTAGGEAYAIAKGYASYDASKKAVGSTNELLKAYGELGSTTSSVSAELSASRSNSRGAGAAVTSGFTQGDALIKITSTSTNPKAIATTEQSIGLISMADVGPAASTTKSYSQIDGTANSATAYAGAWDQRTATMTHTKNSNENAYSSTTGNLHASASSYLPSTDVKKADIGEAKARIATEAVDESTAAKAFDSKVSTEIKVDSLAQRGMGPEDKLASGIAYIDSGVVSAVSRKSSTAYTQVSGTTDSLANGWGFGAGSQLRNNAGDANNRVYAGMMFSAIGQMYQKDPITLKPYIGPLLTTDFKTYSQYGTAGIQGAKTTGWSALDTAGAVGTIRNFQIMSTDPIALPSVYSTSWTNQYAIGWAEGSNPSTFVSSWNDLNNLKFTGVNGISKPTGKITASNTNIVDGARTATNKFSTENKWVAA